MADVRSRGQREIMCANHRNRGGLEDAPFSYHAGKDGKVFISWRGQRAAVLGGQKATAFLSRIAGLDGASQQLAMAKVTGNFKRGNEHRE